MLPQPTPTVNASPPPSSPTSTQSTPEVSTPIVDNSSTDTNMPSTNTGSNNSTNESTPQTDTSGTTETSTGETGTTETTTEASTTETSEPQTETTETESSPSDSGDGETQTSETEDSGTSQNENESDSESTSEVSEEETSTESESSESEESVEESTEESTEESSEESSEETSEEETTEEETTEEESSEEESSEEESESEESEDEESSEEESEEESEDESDESSSEDEEEEEEKDKKKKTFAPPIISANVASMQNIDGTFNQTMTIGVSRSSLLGTETYAVNAMVWDNLQQFMLNGSYSKVHINDEGRVNRVYSASIGGARMFTTTMGNLGQSLTYLGKKGSVKGVALSTSLISVGFQVVEGNIIQDAVLLTPALTGFWTRSFNYSPKLIISPMVAVSSPFLLHDWFNQTTTWNKDVMAIIGSSFNIGLTKRFKLNVGVNTIHNTNPDIPMTWNFTIGSRFSL